MLWDCCQIDDHTVTSPRGCNRQAGWSQKYFNSLSTPDAMWCWAVLEPMPSQSKQPDVFLGCVELMRPAQLDMRRFINLSGEMPITCNLTNSVEYLLLLMAHPDSFCLRWEFEMEEWSPSPRAFCGNSLAKLNRLSKRLKFLSNSSVQSGTFVVCSWRVGRKGYTCRFMARKMEGIHVNKALVACLVSTFFPPAHLQSQCDGGGLLGLSKSLANQITNYDYDYDCS